MLFTCVLGCIESSACTIELWSVIVNAVIMFTGVAAIIITAFQFKRQNSLSFYEKYTARYEHIIEHIPEAFFLQDEQINIVDKEKINHYIRLYIDLCSEEYFLYKKGFVNDKIWKEWDDGIKGMFKHPLVHDFWNKNAEIYNKEYTSFYKYITKE